MARFFKDRKWLFTEFPELTRPCTEWETCDETAGSCHAKSASHRNGNDSRGADDEDDDEDEDDDVKEGKQQQQEKEETEEEEEEEEEAATLLGDAAAKQSLVVDADRWQASSNSRVRVLEVGCGAGNTVFPLLQNNKCVFPMCLVRLDVTKKSVILCTWCLCLPQASQLVPFSVHSNRSPCAILGWTQRRAFFRLRVRLCTNSC